MMNYSRTRSFFLFSMPVGIALVLLLALFLSLSPAAGAAGIADPAIAQEHNLIADQVVINEFAPKGTEWVELYNSFAVTVTITGWYLDDADCGSASSFIGTQDFGPGDFFVVNASDAGDNFSLDNSGDIVVLCDSGDTEIDRVGYGDEGNAPIAPSSFGSVQYSTARLVDGQDTNDDAQDFNIDPTSTISATNDVAGNNLGGSLLINEIDVFPVSGNDFVELYNPTASPVAVTDWYISDGDDVAVLSGTLSVPAGGFLALEEGVDWAAEGSGVDFSSADVAYLFDDTRVRVDQLGWAGEFEDDCFARVPNGAGPNDGYNWTSSDGGITLFDQACTFGASNNLVDVGVDKNGPSAAVIGVDIVYDITVSNNGVVTATGVTLTDTLPLNTAYVADNIGMATEPIPGTFVWSLGEVGPAVGSTYQLTVTLTTSVTDGSILTNTVEINATEVDTDPTNNVDTLTTQAFSPFSGSEAIGLTRIGGLGVNGSEIAAHDPVSQTLFVVTGGDIMDVLDISDPMSPTLAFTVSVAPYGSGANSVDFYNGVFAVAVESGITTTLPGSVVFFDQGGNYLNDVPAGVLPDMLTFTPDGQALLVANEGEPNDAYTTDPEGSITVVDLSGGVASATSVEIGFTQFTTSTISPDIRIYGPGATVAQDVEPEYIALSADGSTAYVTLQENNALAVVDLQAMTVTQLVPLGFVDHSLSGNEFDPSDSDGGINIANWPVFGMFQPDAITSYEVDGTTYLVTANEGDARDYSGFSEEVRVSDLVLDSGVFTPTATYTDPATLGRLKTTTVNGDAAGDGEYEEIYNYGSRSFSIWAADGSLVYDSGSAFEQITAIFSPATFNSNGSAGSFDTRSDDKGPEPEGVTTAVLNGQTYAFIGLERIGGLVIYDVTDPNLPIFVDYVPPGPGDISPEGLLFIPADESPIDKPLLVVSYEFSGTTAIFVIDVDAEISVGKTGPAYGMIGGDLVYTFNVSNDSSTLAEGVVITDTLPVSTTYVGDNSGVPPTNPSPGVYVWDLGDLPAQAAVTVQMTVTTDVSITSGTVLTNSLEISTTSSGDDLADNTATAETTMYPLVTTYDIQTVADPVSDDGSPFEGQMVWVEGVVTAEPDEIDDEDVLVIQDLSSGPWSGLPVHRGGENSISAPEGTYLRLLGEVEEFFGLTQLQLEGVPNAMEVLSTGVTVPAAEVLPTVGYDDADKAVSEQWEGVLLEFQDATVTDDNLGFGEWYFDDTSGPTRADDLGSGDGDLSYDPVDGDVYIFIRGVGWWSFGNYKLAPRYDADIRLEVENPSIGKDGPSLVAPGELFTYTISVESEVGFTLTNVVITDVVPANATFAYALDGGSESGGVVSWTFPSLLNQSSVTARFAVTATTSLTTIVNDQYAVAASNFVTPTFGALVATQVGSELRIHDIQGAQHFSLFANQDVADINGIVTVIRSNGFWMQDPMADSNIGSSEGIFVFTGSSPSVAIGDEVEVDGVVNEFRVAPEGLSRTEIGSTAVVVLSSGNAVPAPVVLGTGGRVPPAIVIDDDANGDVEISGTFDPVTDGIDFYESVEGMLVQVNDALVVAPTRSGQIYVVGDNGANGGLLSSRDAIVVQDGDFNPERIIIDDALVSSEPQVFPGDVFTGTITGVMDYSSNNFKFLNTAPLPSVVSAGLLQETSPLTGTTDQLLIASFNVLNLDPGDSAGKFADLASQIVNNLNAPDIIALQEIQDNNGGTDDGTVDASLTYNTLIAAITTAGGPTYEFRDIAPINNQDGGAPGSNIRVGFLFRPDRVTFVDRPGGDATTPVTVSGTPMGVVLSFSPGRVVPTDPAFDDSRKSLAGEFLFNGHKLIVIANHFKSKSGDGPLFGRLQPAVQSTLPQRELQGQAINAFVDSILALDPFANVIVLGDLNDFHFSTALGFLEDGVLTNLMDQLPDEEKYTFIFDGNAQTLDHILVSDYLLNFGLPSFDIVHTNVEYGTGVAPSDHEPILARMTPMTPFMQILPFVPKDAPATSVR